MATRCSTNPPLCLTARYTSVAFQRCSQLSFAVAMIIRSIHFRCCAMRIRAIPSPFQRKTALRVSVADQRISLLFPCFAMRCPASRLIAIAARLEAARRLALAFLCTETLYFAIPSRFDSSQCHCQTMLRLSFLCPCVSVRGDSLLCHSFAKQCTAPLCNSFAIPSITDRTLLCHSFAIPSVTLRRLASATHCSTQPCRCFSGRIEATRSDAQPSRVTASQYFAFTMQNISQRLRCSTTPSSTFPLRCRDTHRPAKPLLFFWFQNRTQPILCSSWPCGAPPLRCYLCLASLRHSLPRITLLFLCCAEHC